MSTITLSNADEVSPDQLSDFLGRFYSPVKGEFLHHHGDWWHKGNSNRWVLLVDGALAAYCAVIPTQIVLDGTPTPALWWVDLVVAPEFRGQGLQSIFDEKIRLAAEIKLGFPNRLAADIHRKHGWNVRNDLQVLMLPLQPRRIRTIQEISGIRGHLLRAGAHLISPLAWLARRIFLYFKPVTAWNWHEPAADQMAAVFQKYYQPRLITTYRSTEHIQWRYLDSPFRSEYCFYGGGPPDSPTYFLIARHVRIRNILRTRILDVFGDFQDAKGLKDILKLAIRDAVLKGSSQVTVMNSLPELSAHLKSVGFLIKSQTRFCWHTSLPATMTAMTEKNYWTLADSDNDEPE
jgi:GNAT superfamily N-acetyltransferase